MKLSRTRRTIITMTITLIGLGGLLFAVDNFFIQEAEYRSFNSPDGNFRVVVFRKPSLFARWPGQSGDATGTVKLIDDQQNVLQQTPVSMVQAVDRVVWYADRVDIKLVAEWPLPVK